MEVSLIADYLAAKQARLMTQVSLSVLKKSLDFNTQLATELIQKMAQTSQQVNNNPTNTGVFLNIRV